MILAYLVQQIKTTVGKIMSFKKLVLLCTFLIISIFLCIPTSATLSYQMFCRNGGDMQIGIESSVSNSGTHFTGTHFKIYFKKSQYKYDFANPKLLPGECTWKDRAIRKDEPSILLFSTRANIAVNYKLAGNKKPELSAKKNEKISDDKYAKLVQFLTSLRNDEYFTLTVIANRGDRVGFKIKLE